MNQQIEVDALGRKRFVSRDRGVGALLASVFEGLWHNTQYSVLLRKPPCNESATWQVLQLLSATTVRRGSTAEPSTEKFTTGFVAASVTLCEEVVPANTVTDMRASPPMVYVPVEAVGIACVKV